MYWGIRKTALALSVGPAAVIAVVLTVFFIILGARNLNEGLERQGQSLALRLAAASEFGLVTGNRTELQHLLQASIKESDVSAISVLDSSFRILASAGPTAANTFLPAARNISPGHALQYQDHLLIMQQITLPGSTQADPFTSPRQPNTAQKPAKALGYMLVALSYRQTQIRTGVLITTALTILTLGLILTALFSVWLSKRITQPVIRLAQATAATARGDLKMRVSADSHGELLLLEKGFNQMADAIEQSQLDLESRIDEATRQYLRQKESAEAANLAKSRFLAAASHDLRQPLHSIGLFVGALSSKIKFPEVRSLVDKIEESVTTLESLLNALLDISRLDAAVITPQFATFPINVVLHQIDNEFTPLAASKNLRFKVRPSYVIVSCDPMLLKRIIGNLVANAIRYTEEGRVLVGSRKRGDSLRIEVWDSGPGIAPEHHDHIFEEFYQIGNARRDRNKGLGLGLAIVDRMARLLGIKAGLFTQPGRGSCFYVELPLAQEIPSHIPVPEAEIQIGGAHIVVVDDERLVLEGMSALLQGMGSHVITAESHEEAIQHLRASGLTPDLILSDYRLGSDQTGIDVIRALRQEFGSSIPAILISGDTSPETLHQAHANHLEILHKPVNTAKLKQTLAKLTAPT